MTSGELGDIYRAYIACLNAQDWGSLDRYVMPDVVHNGQRLGTSGYRQMLEGDFAAIPDLHFDIAMLVIKPPLVSSRLRFDCTPVGILFDLPVNGRRVTFHENVIYRFNAGRIEEVWSIIDRAAIAAQLK